MGIVILNAVVGKAFTDSAFSQRSIGIDIADYADCRARDLRFRAGLFDRRPEHGGTSRRASCGRRCSTEFTRLKTSKDEEIADASQDFASGHRGRSGALGRWTKPGVC
jgi:hypothetical protein